jgi:hypothetical protein
MSYTLLRQRNRMQKLAKADRDLMGIFNLLDEAWMKAFKLAEARDLVEARARDKGEVCWMLFFPRKYYGEQQPCIGRSPNLRVESLYLGGAHTRVVKPADVWKDLAESWKTADPEMMADRRGRVDREFRAWQERLVA